MREENVHLIEVIEQTQRGLFSNDSNKLRELSNQTIHQASAHQDEGCITLAVLIYTLSKLIERRDHGKMKNWDKFEQMSSTFDFDNGGPFGNEKREDRLSDLLRRQHAAYVRMVKRHLSDNKQWQPQTGVGKAIKVSIIGELDVILAAFARYKAGMKS